eukprot:MONOS_15195.1-p1 / transcript=MONOS_15195.1 / gene=MONOS_15195 / organism=Monocercomonoides_exilis_PA203 / gene_product=unspecified product / transcript_product=unspecified product / location=Mono_scaffold01167:14701-15084(-) / protein_length=80 / sequence_SO=supercontig / SO=protein_coding / is_pseudo=false
MSSGGCEEGGEEDQGRVEREPIKNGLLMSMGVLQGLIVLLVFLCMMGPVVWLSFSVQSAGDFEEGDAVPAGRSGKQKEN